MDRRLVIYRVLAGTTALVLAPGLLTSCEKAGIETEPPVPKGPVLNNDLNIDLSLNEYSVLNNTGGSKVVNGIIIVNMGSNGFIALASACTHQGTQISFSNKSNNFVCPTHGSVFSTNGSVIQGPASIALKSYNVARSGNILTITE